MSFHVPREKKVFDLALKYLRQSEVAEAVIDELERTSTAVEVLIDRHAKNGFGVHKSSQRPFVTWNPTYMLKTTFDRAAREGRKNYCGMVVQDQTGYVSPALLLLHELGHAYQFLSDATAYQREMQAQHQAVLAELAKIRQARGFDASQEAVFDALVSKHEEPEKLKAALQPAWKALKEQAMQVLKAEGRLPLEEANVAGIENQVAMELRGKGYTEGLRWWYADNEGKPTPTLLLGRPRQEVAR